MTDTGSSELTKNSKRYRHQLAVSNKRTQIQEAAVSNQRTVTLQGTVFSAVQYL